MILNKIQVQKKNYKMVISSLFILSIIALVGCGSGGGDTSPDPTPTPSATPTPIPSSTPAPSPTPTPGELPDRKIVFVSLRDGGREIYIMDADGANQRRLTNDSALRDNYNTDPTLSPDGTKIAYGHRDASGNDGLRTMNVDGTDQRLLINPPNEAYTPRWSPDGRKLVYYNFNSNIFTINADGTGVTQIPGTGAGSEPDFSANGTKIVYRNNADLDIYTINTDGSGKTRLTNTPGVKEFQPRWSPDGTKILYYTETVGAPPQILVMNADGTRSSTVISGNQIYNPSWSPDGKKVVYAQLYGSPSEIFRVNLDGTGVSKLTNNTTEDSNPSW
jgi:Tol biopolymer transport system component